jgi:hypothetical protein
MVTSDSSEFQLRRDALQIAISESFPDAVIHEFGGDTENPGVKVDLATERGMANVILWSNLSFDVEAIENRTGRLLVRKSTEAVSQSDVASTIAELASELK